MDDHSWENWGTVGGSGMCRVGMWPSAEEHKWLKAECETDDKYVALCQNVIGELTAAARLILQTTIIESIYIYKLQS